MNDARYGITIASGGRTVVAVDEFSLSDNEITFLFGESGIGKSILCKAIYGLLDPDALRIFVNGMPYTDYLNAGRVRDIKQTSFFVFQEPSSHLHPLMRITEQLREGSISRSEGEEEIFTRLWKTSDVKSLHSILDIYPKPYRPSGGEKQRILLAMAFKKIEHLTLLKARGVPTFFVFDEPTGSLDNNYRNLFLNFLFDKYKISPFTAIIITHDYSIISEVYARHGELSKRIHFKEISRLGEGKVELHDFSAQEYLSWLRETRPAGGTAARASEPVLDVASSFTIFGKERVLYKDKGRTRPSNLVIRGGEMVYVKAPSGVGKTTLAKIIMGLYSPEKFSMKLCGIEVTEETPRSLFERRIWGRHAGMVFQHADEALDLEATVAETFAGLPAERAVSREELQRGLDALFEGGVSEEFLSKKVKYLSGGQKQRLNLLRTIILRPDLIILDEPLNGLDFSSVRKIIAILEEQRTRGSALLMISHNEEIFDALVGEEHVYYLT